MDDGVLSAMCGQHPFFIKPKKGLLSYILVDMHRRTRSLVGRRNPALNVVSAVHLFAHTPIDSDCYHCIVKLRRGGDLPIRNVDVKGQIDGKKDKSKPT